jgi:cytochrome P450
VPSAALSGFTGDLLAAISEGFYRRTTICLRTNGRDVVVLNDPDDIRTVLSISVDAFPKSDLMIAALRPLLGDGMLISNGQDWRRQRRMLEPALDQMRVRRIFPLMAATIADFIAKLRSLAPGTEIELNREMSFIALDVVFRTIFSRPIGAGEAAEISAAFSEYQDKAPQNAMTTLFGEQTATPPRVDELAAIAGRIRQKIAALVDERLDARSKPSPDDILQTVIEAQDPDDGSTFSREELVDQITVLFLAGHETSASALTWAVFILSQQPQLAIDIREQAIALAGASPLTQDQLIKITLARDVFRETLRLYPPAGFITRVTTAATTIGKYPVEAGSFIVISPWLIHRHRKHWKNSEIFDPGRFSAEREREIVTGAFLPFGLGARVCTGRTLAMIEGPLVIAELMRALRFTPLEPETVMPSFCLTVRPAAPIRCLVEALPLPASVSRADAPA